MAADAHTPPKPVDVLGILNPPAHRFIGQPQWRFVDQHRRPKPRSIEEVAADPREVADMAECFEVFNDYEALMKMRVKDGVRPPRLAVIDANELEACRALVSRMAAGLARIAFMGSESGVPTPDLLALWRSEAREIAREALTWLPVERVIAEEVERGVMVMNAKGEAWGLAYADGQASANGWIKPTDAPIHDARYVTKPTDVCGGTWTTSGRELHHLDLEQLKGAKVVSVERRTVVSAMR